MTSPSRLTEVSILVRHLVPIRQINETLIEPRLTTQTQTVSTPFNCIHRANPYASYNSDKVSHFLRTAGIMSCYPNTLGLAAANALVNNHQSLRATPVIKAVIRDLKRYMIWSNKYNGTRILPVSYSATDVLNITRPQGFLEYLYLGDQASAVDFWMVSCVQGVWTKSETLTSFIVQELFMGRRIEYGHVWLGLFCMFAS